MKRVYFTFICLLIIFLYSCDKFGAGSNINSEDYKVNTSEQRLLAAVDTFKKLNPKMCPPDSSIKDYFSDPFHRIFFYYSDSKSLISTYIRGDNKTSIFGLVAIRKDGEDYSRTVNDEITGSENMQVKKDFEERILYPIKALINGNK